MVKKLLSLEETVQNLTNTTELPADVELLISEVRGLIQQAGIATEKQVVIDRSVELNLG